MTLKTCTNLAVLLGLAAAIHPLQAQPDVAGVYECGNENQSTCKVGDFERYNMRYWTENRCEPDLDAQDGVCVDKSRHQLAKTSGWLGWALAEQRYSITAQEPLNYTTLLGSHNAFSNAMQGFQSSLYTNHHYSISDQLNFGVRHLELDPHFYGAAGIYYPGRFPAMRLCHASNTAFCEAPGYATRLFGFALTEIATWLRANPGEVIVIKLNDKSNSNPGAMRAEINNVLGSFLYRPPSTFTRWPTMSEIRAAGKQVLFMQHDQQAPVANGVTWNAYGRVLADNHPKDQNFDTCTAYDGTTPLTRPATNWWDTAEGRTGLNVAEFNTDIGTFDVNMDTGFYWEQNVRKATNCGVSIIGLDFVNALWSEYNLAPRYNQADGRVNASIWSWDENDYGNNGAAVIKTNSRWASRSIDQPKHMACGLIKTPGSPNQDRKWRITDQFYAWNKAIGNNVCATLFNNGTDRYEFAYPANGYQNKMLAAEIARLGISGDVWIGYSKGPQSLFAVQPNEVVFTMLPGGQLPAQKVIRVYGPGGARVAFNSPVSWFGMPIASGQVIPLDSQFADLRLVVNSAASTFIPGRYPCDSTILAVTTVNGVNSTTTIPFNCSLYVKSNSTTTLSARTNPIRFGESARFDAAIRAVGSSVPISGTVDLARLSPDSTAINTITTTASSNAVFDVPNLSVGTHRFIASFNGSNLQVGSESAEYTLTVLPRINAGNMTATLSMQRGGPLPATQLLPLSNFSSGLNATLPQACSWLTPAIQPISGTQANLILTPLSAAASLDTGNYTCNVTVGDSLSASQGSTTVTVTLLVKTSLSLKTNSMALLSSTRKTSAIAFLSTAFNSTIPLTANASAPWLSALLEYALAPANPVIIADPVNLAPGVYNGYIDFNSELAVSPARLTVTFTVVRETTIASNPPGLQLVVDNTPYTTPATFTWAPGTQHQLTTNTVQGDANTRYRFSQWAHVAAQTNTVTAAINGATYTANFNPEYRLQADATPGGSITISPLNTGNWYANNANVNLTAVPSTGYKLAGWSGALTGTNLTGVITMNAPQAVTATFVAEETVPITLQSTAPGTVVTVDGTPVTLPATLNWIPGRSYRVAAPGSVDQSATIRWMFQTWNVPGSNVIDYVPTKSPATLAVKYQKNIFITTTVNPPNAGVVTGGGWQTASGVIPITATANSGYTFTSFSGALTGSTNPQSLALAEPVTVVANFTATVQPALYFTTGARVDGLAADQRSVTLQVRNIGQGSAADVQITGITNIQVLTGTGVVSLASTLPISLGNLNSGAVSNQPLLFQWPATAARVQFTLQYTVNGVAATSTLTLFR